MIDKDKLEEFLTVVARSVIFAESENDRIDVARSIADFMNDSGLEPGEVRSMVDAADEDLAARGEES